MKSSPHFNERTFAPAGRNWDGLIAFDTELRLVRAPSLRDPFAHATVAQHFQAYEGQPLTIPTEAADPKAEYLEWHSRELYGK